MIQSISGLIRNRFDLAKISATGKDIDGDVFNFLKDNPNPPDATIHAFAEKNGYAVDDVEAAAYRLAGKFVKFMTGGFAVEKGVTKKDVNPEELEMGIQVEQEHIKDPEVAEKVALDHLAEIGDYYTRLKKMEVEAEH